MTTRHSRSRFSAVFLAAALAGVSLMPIGAIAETTPVVAAPAGDSVQQPYYGILNQDNVYVRSGPSDVFYATAKLAKGAKVAVVAVRDPWLKIVPPEGSYCYVARAYVEKRGDGSVGRVTKAELNVRAGSTLNGLKTTVLTSLSEGDDVKILGEQEEYFKIAPPPGAYLYIMRTYVDPAPQTQADQPIVASGTTKEPIPSAPIPTVVTPPTPVTPVIPTPVVPTPVVPTPVAVAPVPTPVVPTPVPPPTPVAPTPVAVAPVVQPPVVPPAPIVPPVKPVVPAPVAVAPVVPVTPTPAPVTTPPVAPIIPVVSVTPTPTTHPAIASSGEPATQPSVAVAPATQPALISADARFDAVESTFAASTKLPIDQQPLDTMLTEYTALATDTSLPTSMQRIAAKRVATIKLRADAQKQYLEAQRFDSEAKARQLALKAEQQELVQKAKDQEVTIYTALGTLRISSLQQSGTTMYRLTDPTSGRTLVYVKSNDPKYSGLLNQFVGVRGDITEDSNLNLKVITPTGVDTVDQAKVNSAVTATVMPPSLLPRTSTASVGN